MLDAFHPRLPCLRIDDVAGGMLATRHLIELGHERIAFLGDRPELGPGLRVERAAPRRLPARAPGRAAAGAARAGEGGGRTVATSRARLTTELLTLDEPPTAIFAASDSQALGVLEAAGFEGFAVPDDLSVVGFDDIEVASYVGLTTVHQPLAESGSGRSSGCSGCVDDEGSHRTRSGSTSLVVRRTTAPYSGNG